MADMSLDELLSSSLKSAAEPAASAGVAAAIRARVAAGDAGTSAAGTTAPGWGGGASGILTIVAPLVLVALTGGVGAALGVTGVFGTTQAAPAGDIPAYVLNVDTAGGSLCPGGPVVDRLPAGTRVYAVARTDDGTQLGIRNPADAGSLLWFASGDVALDEGSADPATLPVAGCPEVTVTLPTPTPVVTEQPTTPPDDGTDNAPPPPADTTAPLVTSLKPSKSVVLNNEVSTISVASSDDVGVTKVVLSWSNGFVKGKVTLGANDSYDWSSNGTANNTYGNYTFTAIAYDAAGNSSAPAQVVVNRQYLG
ncbi:MAG: hypothetical protein JWP32_1896 [Schumannella sp.]|nr:hypothetical protein [Schumannella sp.]